MYDGARYGKAAELTKIPCDIKARYVGLASDNKNKIFFSGGFLLNEISKKVTSFSVKRHSTENLADLKVGRSAHSCAFLGDNLYVYGGSDEGQEFLKSIEIISTNSAQSEIGS